MAVGVSEVSDSVWGTAAQLAIRMELRGLRKTCKTLSRLKEDDEVSQMLPFVSGKFLSKEAQAMVVAVTAANIAEQARATQNQSEDKTHSKTKPAD